jgi:hypothetical protein
MGATGAYPQKHPLPIYRPPVRGMDGLVSLPNWKALPLVASYDRQALAVDEFLPARIHTGHTWFLTKIWYSGGTAHLALGPGYNSESVH